ncbi:ABC transporter ATP-binding protein [Nonomuraea sp. NPDC004297]
MRNYLRLMRHVLRLSFTVRPWTALISLVIIVAKSASIPLVALAQAWIVNGTNSAAGLVGAGLIGASAYAATAAGNRIERNLRFDIAERVDLRLTHDVLITSASIPTIEHLENAEELDRLDLLRRGTYALASTFWSVIEMLAAIVSLALSLWLLASVHPGLALVVLLCAPPLLMARLSQQATLRAQDANAALVRREQKYHDLCVQAGPAKEVWISGNGSLISVRADNLWRDISTAELRARVRGALWRFGGWLCFGVGFAIVLFVVTSLAARGAATFGDVVMAISLGTRLRGQVAHTVSMVGEVDHGGNAAKHFLWLKGYAAAQPAGKYRAPARLENGVSLRDVAFRYPGSETDALHGIDLHLPAGRIVGLVGENGSGKSTLVKLLTGAYRPTSGAVLIDGMPLDDVQPKSWATSISAVFQDFVKYEFKVRETVGVGDLPYIADASVVMSAVERAGAASTVKSVPYGLESQLGAVFDGAELSHGQWQQLALARCAMRREPLLEALDEPTAALDPQVEHELFERFIHISRDAATRAGTVTVLVSHRFSTLHMADLIVVLRGGCVVERGSHAELMAMGGQYASLYRAQAASYA